MSFDELGLSPETLRAVKDAGYLDPTPIQRQAIPYVQMGRDIVGVAQTGTGKTAGFTLPLIDILAGGQAKARMPRALILEPTRELADQVQDSFIKYGKYHRLTTALLIGGVSFSDQERLLDRGVDVLIATPGRLLDHFERGKVMLTGVKILVIDEADRMMDMGFMPDVERIVSLTPPLRQSLFFSATMPPEMRRLANTFLTNPKEISVAPPASPAERVQQSRIAVGKRDKRAALIRLLRLEDVKNALIFCNRKRDVDLLYKALKKEGFNAGAIHGDLAQTVRMETLDAFKTGKITLLVASDVAARGLDVQGLSHVFNYDVPMSAEDYVHRIGRTGRAGLSGRAYMLVTPDDDRYLAAIHSLIKRDIPSEKLPGDTAAAAGDAGEIATQAMDTDKDSESTERQARKPARNRRRREPAVATADAEHAAAPGAAAEAVAAQPPTTVVAGTDESRAGAEDVGNGDAAPKQRKPRRRRSSTASARKEDKSAAVEAEAPLAETEMDAEPAARASAVQDADDEPADPADEDAAHDRHENAREAAGASSPQPRKSDPPATRGRRTDTRRRGGRAGGERGNGNDARAHEGGKPVIGMGDHVPAFMTRPVRRQQG